MTSFQRLLPWQKPHIISQSLDGSLYPCEIRESLIPNAGNGRFSKSMIPANTVVMKKQLINVFDNKHNIWDHDKVIIIKDLKELNELINIFMMQFNKSKEEVIIDLNSYFGAIDNKLFLNTTSVHDNHSKDPNAKIIFDHDNGYYYYKTLRKVNKNEEFYISYQKFTFPQFYIQLLRKHNLMDLPSMSQEWDKLKTNAVQSKL